VITSLRYKSNDGGFTYDKRRHIFVIPADGEGEAKQITDGDWDDGPPSWSPDGRSLAFASSRHEERDYDSVADIWIVSAEGGEPRQLTPGRGPSQNPRWSPDGATIAYVGNEYALDMGRNNDVFVIPVEGGEHATWPRSWTAPAPFFGNIEPLCRRTAAGSTSASRPGDVPRLPRAGGGLLRRA
jgi:dipeptidyl aminopeptidase/acylaminoacyl peptidase